METLPRDFLSAHTSPARFPFHDGGVVTAHVQNIEALWMLRAPLLVSFAWHFLNFTTHCTVRLQVLLLVFDGPRPTPIRIERGLLISGAPTPAAILLSDFSQDFPKPQHRQPSHSHRPPYLVILRAPPSSTLHDFQISSHPDIQTSRLHATPCSRDDLVQPDHDQHQLPSQVSPTYALVPTCRDWRVEISNLCSATFAVIGPPPSRRSYCKHLQSLMIKTTPNPLGR